MPKNLDVNSLSEIIDVAKGKKLADLLLKNGKLVNVFNEEIEEKDVLIHTG